MHIFLMGFFLFGKFFPVFPFLPFYDDAVCRIYEHQDQNQEYCLGHDGPIPYWFDADLKNCGLVVPFAVIVGGFQHKPISSVRQVGI